MKDEFSSSFIPHPSSFRTEVTMQTATFVPSEIALARPIRWLAALLQQTIIFRALNAIADIEVRGREHLRNLQSPCIFVANHSSHLDTVCIMRALPWHSRLHIAIPAAADYWFSNPLVGTLASLSFNLIPLQRTGSACGSLKRASHLLTRGWSLLIYPEGTRSTSGRMGTFKGGAALLAIQHQVPLVPIKLEGAYQILPKGRYVPHRGNVVVKIGESLRFAEGEDYREAIKQV